MKGGRVARRLLIGLGLVLVLLGGAGAGSQAHADGITDTLCKEVPKPQPPNWGAPGLLTAPKDLSTVPDQTPDVFAPDSTLRISDVYGWSAHYDVYDLGCGNSFLSDPAAVMNTNLANSNIEFEQTNLALLAGAEDIVKSDQLVNWLGDTLQTISTAITPIIFGGDGRPGWLGLAFIAVALIMAWNVRRMGYHDTARILGVVAGAIVLTAFALLMPVSMNEKLDQAVTSVAQTASSTGVGNASPSDLINRESTYHTWLANNFGDANSKLAAELGPKLWAATHYSYSDMKAIDANPDARKKLDELKAAQFKDVATRVKDTDPSAYERFTGRADRNNSAFLGALVSGLMSVFQWISLTMMALARLMMPALVIAAPFLALVGVLQVTRGHTALASLWDMFTASILAVAKFGIASAVMTLVMTAIFRSDTLNPGWKVFLLIIITVIGIMITKPIRTLKTIIPGMDPNKQLLKISTLTGLLGTFAAAKAGGAAGAAATSGGQEDDEEPSDEPAQGDKKPKANPKAIPVVHHDTPALPPPVFTEEKPPTATYSAHQVMPETPAAAPVQERAWKGLVSASAAAELPVGSRIALPAGRGADIDTGAAAIGQLPPPIGPGGSGGGASSLPGASENEIPTIKPTGIYLDDAGTPEYIRMEDPQLDVDGVEHTEMNEAVTYQSDRARAAIGGPSNG